MRRQNMLRAIDARLTDGAIEITLTEYAPKRSENQHNTFWAWCEVVARYVRDAGQPCCGEAVHDTVLGHVYGWEERGFGQRRPRRTLTRPRRMSKVEHMELLTRFEEWASSELGLMLPRPETWDEDLRAMKAAA